MRTGGIILARHLHQFDLVFEVTCIVNHAYHRIHCIDITGSTAKTGQQADSKAAANATRDNGVVDLSNSTLIQGLEEQIKSLPEVNQARVDLIKQALSNGEYEADAEVIARKYSEIEKLLP